MSVDKVVHQPVFLGRHLTPIFGVLSTPTSGRVRGTVVVCPSLGKEQAETTRGMRLLAAHLADCGFAVLRFDYLHTGESWGRQDDPAALDGWLGSIRAAVEYLRGFGTGAPALVGHRAGALLAVQEPALLGELAALVLWDPVRKGSQFLRAKTVLYRSVSDDDGSVPGPRPPAVADVDPARVHVAGHSLDAGVAERFRAMSMPTDDIVASLPPKCTMLVRDTEIARFAALAEVGAEVRPFGDQEPFLAPTHPSYLASPVSEISYIVEWLDRTMPHGSVPVARRHPADAVSGVVAHTADGRPIETRVNALADGTMVWDTAIAGRHESATQVFVAYSLGQYIRTGPGRLWWETAVAVADRGGRAIRFDRPGVGEAGPDQPSDIELPLYTGDYVKNGLSVTSLLAALPPGSVVAHAGICVGSWSAVHGALELTRVARSTVTSTVVLVNPLMWRLAAQNRRRANALSADIGVGGMPEQETPKAITMKVYRKLNWLGSQSAPGIRRRFPRPAHTVVGRLPFIQMPEVLLRRLGRSGIAASLVFSPRDNANFVTFLGGDDALRRAPSARRRVAALGDHTAYHRMMREAATEECLDVLGLGPDPVQREAMVDALSDKIQQT